MDNATFVESWNSIIPHKIKPADLEHPTESFMCRSLVSFFRMMKYDVSEFDHMYNEPKESTIRKRVQIVANTNHFYQLCMGSKQRNFLYVDLIKPSPKKTIHVLNILLNYLFYINMVRDETIEKATQCTARYHELEANINQQKREMENHKIKINNIEQNISKMRHQLPQLESDNDKLRETKQQLLEKIAATKAADEELAEKITKLKMDYAMLQDRRVDDEEAAALIRKNEELEAEIEEYEKQEKTLQTTNSEYATLISQIKPCIFAAEEILQNPQDDSLMKIKNQVDTLRLNYSKLEAECARKTTTLQALQKNCEAIRDYVTEVEKQLSVGHKAKRKTERQTISDLGKQQMQLDELHEQNDVYLEQIKALKEEMLLIMQMSEQAKAFLMRDPVNRPLSSK
ncbi:AAEL013453-PA [Aedes aegypti]|uniref:AAEL013453-PA n=2 Tax=Aedes aegypti TaxID=7159 RepID=A0A1S4FZ96_AEDAE|nr:cingulin [Aedes aegypti]EAT34289.1 AAEL013453-PA [Aedes aegypti]